MDLVKKYIVLGQKWITYLIRKITGITISIFIKLKSIGKKTNVKENKPINTHLHYYSTDNKVKKIEDIELAYIYRKIDQFIMND